MRRVGVGASITLLIFAVAYVSNIWPERPFWLLPLLASSSLLSISLFVLRFKYSGVLPAPVALLLPLLTALLLLPVFGVIKYCVFQMPEGYDLLNILAFGIPGAATIGIALLAWHCLYLLSQMLLFHFRRRGYSRNTRVSWYAAIALIALVPGLDSLVSFRAPVLALLFFSSLLLLDLFLDYRSDSLTWTLVWAFFLAGLGTACINIYRMEKAQQDMQILSGELLRAVEPEISSSRERVYATLVQGHRIEHAGKAYQGALVGSGQIIQFWGQPEPMALQAFISAKTELKSRQWENVGYHFFERQEGSGKKVLLQWRKPGLRDLLPLFSLQFLGLILISALLAFLHRKARTLPLHAALPFDWGSKFRSRIQRMSLGTVAVSYSLIFLFALPFLNRTMVQVRENRIISQARALREEIMAYLSQEPLEGLSTQRLINLSRRYDLDIDLYDKAGKLIHTSCALLYNKSWRRPQMPITAFQQLSGPTNSNFVFSQTSIQGRDVQQLFIRLETAPGQVFYLGIPFWPSKTVAAGELGGFLGAMLTVSVFLLLIASALAMLTANRFSAPLLEISDRLRGMKIGGNQKLEWGQGEDEIGEIISAYNAAVEQVEQSAEKLRQTEREAAWKEMAKQVAHEIKNPLTPMKLNIQYLLHTFRQDPDKAATLLPQAAHALTEQIDGLARIATEFSNFAQMPQAENKHFDLKEAIGASISLFKEQIAHSGGQVHCALPEVAIPIYADKNQLIRVFNNLIQNAIQAVPAHRQPIIAITGIVDQGIARISVRDNGQGIPDAIRQKVFSPNFTTKSSGMGLGLAICKSIVQQAGGHIYFQTETNVGTVFFVELPLDTPEK